MTNVVVDWQVEALDGSRHDVIFVSTGKFLLSAALVSASL